jgi:hypothetical protein
MSLPIHSGGMPKGEIYTFSFPMELTASPGKLAAGKTLTVVGWVNDADPETWEQADVDAATEIGNGWYRISLGVTDTNHERLIISVSEATCQDRMFKLAGIKRGAPQGQV